MQNECSTAGDSLLPVASAKVNEIHDEVDTSVGTADSMNKTVTAVAAHAEVGSNEELADTLTKNVNTNSRTSADIEKGIF